MKGGNLLIAEALHNSSRSGLRQWLLPTSLCVAKGGLSERLGGGGRQRGKLLLSFFARGEITGVTV